MSSGGWLEGSGLFESFIFNSDSMDFNAATEDEDLEDTASDSDNEWSMDLNSESGASNGDDEESMAGDNCSYSSKVN